MRIRLGTGLLPGEKQQLRRKLRKPLIPPGCAVRFILRTAIHALSNIKRHRSKNLS
jgi:hypothetical protein